MSTARSAISARTSSDTSLPESGCHGNKSPSPKITAPWQDAVLCWSLTDGAAPGHERQYPAVSSCLMGLLSPDTVRRNTSAAATRWTQKSKITSYNRHQFERSTL